MDLLDAAWQGWRILFSGPNLFYAVLGTVLAMVVSFLPGINSVALMALAIPFTFGWDPVAAVVFFGAMAGGGTFMGSVTAILFNVPGSSPNAATVIDGYPMAMKGEAKTALACSATASALGATVGVFILILIIPFASALILAFGPPEFLLLAVWGLTALAVVTGESPRKGFAAGGLGLLTAFVGFSGRTGEMRLTFGSDFLRDGIEIMPVFVGLFAIAEIMNLFVSSRTTISGLTRTQALSGSHTAGMLAVFRNFGLFLRSSVIGTIVGVIPGIGGTVASFVAYGHAAQTAKPPRHFGHGDIRGVLAPEAANDAKDGGSLLPVLAFGIPGSESTVLLLAALLMHGITPGRELMENQLPLVFVLIWAVFLANWLTSILGIAICSPLARLTVIRTQWLIPGVLALSALAALSYRGRFGDLVLAGLFGVIGYGMKKHGWPRIPFALALVLGELFESNLHLSLQLAELGRLDPVSRPGLLALVALWLVTVGWAIAQGRRRRPQ